jgi:hypothetical protein
VSVAVAALGLAGQRPLAGLGWPTDRQISVITATLARGWRPARSGRLPTGAAKAE